MTEAELIDKIWDFLARTLADDLAECFTFEIISYVRDYIAKAGYKKLEDIPEIPL